MNKKVISAILAGALSLSTIAIVSATDDATPAPTTNPALVTSNTGPAETENPALITSDTGPSNNPALITGNTAPIATIFVMGKEIKSEFPSVNQMPVRAIAESLGYSVSWDGNTNRVELKKNDTVLTLAVGSDVYTKDGKEMDVLGGAPVLVNDSRTYVPTQYIVKAFDLLFEYKDSTVTFIQNNIINIVNNYEEPKQQEKIAFDPETTETIDWNVDKVVQFLGRDARPDYVPEGLTLDKDSEIQTVVINKADQTVLYANFTYNYVSEDGTHSLTVHASKNELSPLCIRYIEDNLTRSVIDGHLMMIAQMDGKYFAEFRYEGLTYRISGNSLTSGEFTNVIKSILKADLEK